MYYLEGRRLQIAWESRIFRDEALHCVGLSPLARKPAEAYMTTGLRASPGSCCILQGSDERSLYECLDMSCCPPPPFPRSSHTVCGVL